MLGALDSIPSTTDTKNKEEKAVLYRPRLEKSLEHANPVT